MTTDNGAERQPRRLRDFDRPLIPSHELNLSAWLSQCSAVRDLARTLAEASPVVAAREFARGIKRQAKPGQVAAVCAAIRVLDEGSPGIAEEIAAQLVPRPR
jgi:hypothetical protein